MSYRRPGEASQLSVIGCRIVGQARRLPIHGMASGSACPTNPLSVVRGQSLRRVIRNSFVRATAKSYKRAIANRSAVVDL